ncbi:MAG: ABC transporter ATP-binding protein [Patescibacteria group bacterium]
MKKEKQKSIYRHYKDALGNKYFYLFAIEAVLFALSTYITSVLAPIYYQGIVDSILKGSAYDTVMYFLYLIVLTGVLSTIFDRLFEYIDIKAISDGMVKVADYSMYSLTSHSYQFFTNNFAGSLVNKLKKFIAALDVIVSFIIREFLYAIVSVAGIIYVLFSNSFILGLVASTWFAIFFASLVFFTYKRIPLERIRSEKESKLTGVLSDIVSNVLNLKLFSSQKNERTYFGSVLEEDRYARHTAWTFSNKTYTIQSVITLLAKSSLIFVAIFLWGQGQASAGTIVLVISYGTTLFNRLGGLGSAIRKLSDSIANADEFVQILNTPIEIIDTAKPEALQMKEGKIVFDNVGFAYKSGAKILDKFNLKINSGERVGVVGTSGAGKTTLTKILLRFADVTDGAIKIDGQDIRNVTQDDLRSVVSYVPQDPILFHRSLAENIGYGRPGCTMEEIIDAAKKAHAHEFIESLSHGYDTLVGERGVKLSGGERQRVAIARAILKNAPILILDEATSALDSVSETHIKEALEVLMKGKTTIVIAHRLSTIEKMDRIIVMEKGEIVEEGSHKELVAKKGVYQNFWEHQYGGFIK